MCGLIGYVPLKKAEANLDWIKLTMVYNTLRGTDSCGIYINQDVRKGTGTEDDARKWLANNPLIYDDKCKDKTIIAHTRKATYGAKGPEQAHPFVFENEERSMVFAHNGTITNMYVLARKYDVDVIGLTVDSQMLGKIIFEKGYDVLKDYDGAAALIWAYSNEPNTLYAFKGASKAWSTSQVEEERPLFFTYTSNGAYFSSMREPLDAFTNQDGTIYTVTANRVSKFKDNKMDYVTEEIERDDANIRVPVVSHTPMHVSKHADYGKQSQMFSQVGTEKETGTTSTGSINKQALFSVRLHNNSDIYKECSYSSWSTKYANGVLYFMAGRYYSFPWSDTAGTITSHGIDATKHAAPYLEIDAYLLNGYKTMVPYSVDMWTVLQDKHITKDIPRGGVQKYFYEGVMIEDSKVDKFIKNKQYERFKLLDKNPFEKIRQLSSYSAYPVTFSYSESSKVKEAEVLFYQGGRKVLTGKTYQPLFSNRRYGVLEGGKMVAISSYFPKDFILYEDDKDLSIESFINKVQLDSRSKDDADSLEHDFVLLDEYTMIKRYSHLSESIEEDLLQQEEFNGIADTTYFIEPNDRLPLGIEVFTFEGKDVLYAAMFDYVEGYVNMDEDQMSMYAYELATEGLDSGDGLCSFMLKKHGIKFEDFIIDALIAITSDCICEAEEEVGDLLEEHFTDVEFDDVDIATLAIGKNGKISFKNEKGNETL